MKCQKQLNFSENNKIFNGTAAPRFKWYEINDYTVAIKYCQIDLSGWLQFYLTCNDANGCDLILAAH